MLRASFLVLGVALAWAGCGGGGGTAVNTDGGAIPGDGSGSISAKINGVSWSATVVHQATFIGETLNLTGQDGRHQVVTIAIPNVTTPGPYSLKFPSGGAVAQVIGDTATWSTGLPGGDGTVDISAVSAARVAGTFNFVAIASTPSNGDLRVVEGQFDLPF